MPPGDTLTPSRRLARYAGVFRGVTALGMMFSFIIDGNGGTYIAQLSFQFACYFVGILFLYFVTITYVTNTNYFLEDSVIVPRHVEEDAKKDDAAGDVDAEKRPAEKDIGDSG